MQDRFKTIRQHFGLSQSQFAKSIDKTCGFVSGVERGKNGLSQDAVRKICAMYGINESWLVSGEGQMFAEGREVLEADKENAGARIKLIRKREKLAQEEFGKKVGYGKMHVFAVEHKKTMPSNKFLESVASCFHVSYNWLMTGVGKIEAEEAIVDEKLIEWLKKNPDVVKELRIRGGLD